MTPNDIDNILVKVAQALAYESPEVDAKDRILPALTPVRPLAPAWALIAGFLFVFGAIAVASASVVGMQGWRALSMAERIVIFTVLIAAACFTAVACTREMRPAGGRRVSGPAFLVAIAGLLVTFALLFHDYDLPKFVGQGIPCLSAGLVFALAAALLGLLLLRRGFVLDRAAAGIALGTLAGLAGIAGLELHCPNLKASHVMFWHVGVVLSSALIVRAVLARRRRTAKPS
jgi:hypothetical protein